MLDFIYMATSIGFFALCLAAVAFFRMEKERDSTSRERE